MAHRFKARTGTAPTLVILIDSYLKKKKKVAKWGSASRNNLIVIYEEKYIEII